ncbi:uncharacterized protein LOC108031000 [Drosophila biarmipes]|uniref:uncharacterized protein LOC108031000 n=1 Tax=Drosophila biarmipes TaxID=125945 RepID=UPI0007E60383|nr:uncharacterized protein LOC108031000 [Drosophila biarmipes]
MILPDKYKMDGRGKKVSIYSLVEFTNFQCKSLDKEVADFEYCILKSINRTSKYVSAKLKVFKLPIKSLKVNFGLHQLVNGYRPFLYNVTVDGCKFIKNQKSNPVAKFFYDLIKNISNLNHSCPYYHDIIVDKFSSDIVNCRIPKVLPFPTGNYMFEVYWTANERYRAITKLYLFLY